MGGLSRKSAFVLSSFALLSMTLAKCQCHESTISGDAVVDIEEEDSFFDSSADPEPEGDMGGEVDEEISCTSSVDCDDDDPCTTDTCSSSGECEYAPLDADADGVPAEFGPSGEDCGGTDCDDSDDTVYPEAYDSGCDLIDQDCDGSIREMIDDDEDNWIDDLCRLMTNIGDFSGVGDCDDENLIIHPEAYEACNDVDEDCDGDIFDAPEVDDDGDLYIDADCWGGNDCDDENDSVYPGAPEDGCDWIDNDCDGDDLDGFADQDDDGHMNDTCSGGDDCDDLDPTIWTGC